MLKSCSLKAFAGRAQDGLWVSHIFRGYNMVTLLVVANMAFSGLLVSWVMKFADSIMKVGDFIHVDHLRVVLCLPWSRRLIAVLVSQVYATSVAMLVTMVVSIALFGLQPTLQMGLGITTASMSLVLYYAPPSFLGETGPNSQTLPTSVKLPK